MKYRILNATASWVTAIGGTAAVTIIARAGHLNPSTAGFAFLIVIVLTSLRGGLVAGTVASILATLSFNFFFFPPVHTFTIQDPSNWVALAAFLVTSVVISRLVIATRIEADRAEQRRRELETLYGLSVDLFAATNRAGALGEAAGRALTLLGANGGGLVLFDGSPDRQKVVSWAGDKPDE